MSTRISTSVNIAGVELKNPVMTASGTFGSGAEYSEFVDLSKLGAVVTKGVANVPWPGNPTPRVAEVYGGMLNAIGLQNPGIDVFVKRDIPFLKQYDTKIVVNVCGRSTKDYCEVVERLADEPVDLLEINISCPNVKEGGIAFGQNPKSVEDITKEIKRVAKQPVIMKLSPNVTDITETARAAEAGGADALSLINTLTGMKIDINRRKFVLANKTGGMSGPAVKPVAVRMVYQTAQAVKLPIIGMGGIMNAEDALEFILAGATAVSVGTANFIDPMTTLKVAEGIEAYMKITEVLHRMEQYKQEFIEFMVDCDVLKFGEFTLKSGRKSPFFMNAGAYVTGSQLKKLGEYYAKAIHDRYGDDFDVLFGPAYKGIPLSVVTAIAYSELYGKEVRYCSDRKEEKDHGADKGSFLGSKLKDGDRVIMIEDVTTSGKSMEETVPKVKGAADVTIVGLMVSLDRMEVGKGGVKCALDEVKDLYGFETAAIVNMQDVVEHLYNRECDGKVVIDDTLKAAIDAYYEKYGAK